MGMHVYPIRQTTIALTAALMCLATVTGCTTGAGPLPTTPTSHSGITITFVSPSATADIPRPDRVTPEAAKQLCDMISPKIGEWRDQGSTARKADFNFIVHDWAARNGGLNTQVIADRTIVDRITTQNCPDTRRQALAALQIGTLADGLVGFGG
ncbi:hypothetical protein [Nocardia coffeae]|uniref:hypothetical protein n=1 Tax=Nocardia coffeae TaxID=2873381 RepID=UPI001F37C9CA|nr:hypothetical protein [Nocardia coffeae]